MKSLKLIALLALLPALLAAQNVRSIDSGDLANLLENKNDTVYVVNFWATWCSPCIAEIGYFEEIHLARMDEKVKVLLVNLDFPNQVERRVIPFLKERMITAAVFNMTDLDYNSWIPGVDKDWSGAIPATLVYGKEMRLFISRETTREELEGMIDGMRN